MNIQEAVLEIIARYEAGGQVSPNEVFLVMQHVQVIIEKYRALERNYQVLKEEKRASDEGSRELVSELATAKKEIEWLSSAYQTLRQQLFAERSDLREIESLEDQVDSLWGIWGDAGKGRYVRLG